MRATGIDRLDEILGGGLPESAALLVNGPRFTAKGSLARRALVESAHAGGHGILLATSRDAGEERRWLQGLEPGLKDLPGGIRIVDAVSRLFGADEDVEDTHYVDGPLDLNGIAAAFNEAMRAGASDRPPLIVLDSVSTLIAHSDARATFRFLQVLIGRARRAGATVLLLLDDDMHDARDVAWLRHLADGAIETRQGEGRLQLRLIGIGERRDLGWVDYHADTVAFDLTGSFAAGRIR